MSQSEPLHSKGLDDRAREAARSAAAEKGMTLGEYLNQTVRGESADASAGAKDIQKRLASRQNSAAGILERLTKRIEAVEARSTLAISTMDEAILSLVTRLETNEDTSSAVAGYVEGLIEEFRKTQSALQSKVSELEEDNASQKNLETLKALEQALSKLASHVFDEHEMAQNEAAAMRGRMEAGFTDLNERFEGVEIGVNQKLAEASEHLSQTASDLKDLQAQAEERHETLSTQIEAQKSALDSQLAGHLDSVDSKISGQLAELESKTTSQADAASALVEGQTAALREETTEKLADVNSQVIGLQDRLHIAETTTDSALKNLQSTYESLDQRMEDLSGTIDPSLGDSLRAEFEARFEELTAAVRDTVEQTRTQLADEILSAASAHTDKAISDLKLAVDATNQRVADFEPGIAEAELNQRLDDMANGIETRLDLLEGQDVDGKFAELRGEVDEAKSTLASRFDTFTDLVDQRITDHEQRNASAIAQIGDQVVVASQRYQQRQDEAFERMNETINSNQEQVTTRLSDALANVSDRLEQMQSDASTSMSPVQKAIASLASRLELIEDTIVPQAADDEDRLEEISFQDDSAALYEEIGELEGLEIEDLDLEGFETDDPSQASDLEADDAALFDDGDLIDGEPEDVTFGEVETPSSALEADDVFEQSAQFSDIAAEEAFVEVESDEDIEDVLAEEEGNDALTSDDFSFLDELVEPTETVESTVSEQDTPDTITPGAFAGEVAADEWFDPDYTAPREDITTPDALDILTEGDPALDSLQTGDHEPPAVFDDTSSETETAESLAFDDEGLSDSGSQEIDALLAALQEEVNSGSSDTLHPLDDDRTEARDSDVFDDHGEEFSDEAPDAEETELHEEEPTQAAEADPLLLEPIAPEPEDSESSSRQLDEVTSDYISRARQAAIAASATGKTVRPQITERVGLNLGSNNAAQSRLPIYAAASALAVTGAAVGGFIYMRGKQPPEIVAEPLSSDQDAAPVAPATMLAVEEVPTEDLLFDTVAATPTPALPVPDPVETASNAPIAGSGIYPEIPQSTTLQKASDSGNRIAQYVLGQQRIQAGEIREGVTLVRQSANAGLPIAQYELARLHDSGTGVPKDLGLSRSWAEKAAEGGNVKAMYDLAVFMAEGEGGPRSYTGAAEWFRKAAAHGVVDSQYNLGILYEQGLGISQDQAEALYWFTVAANNGDAGAPSKIVQLSDRVDASAKAEVDARAQRWQPVLSPSIANGRFGAQPWGVGNVEQVKGVQTALNALGFDAGPADGIMGAGTAYAIRLYQRTYDLPVTGTVTLELIDSLNAAAIPANG